MSTKVNKLKEKNLALSLILALRAYKPKVTIENELQFTLQQLRAKRRTRPLTGRGHYGRNLQAHFDSLRKAGKE